MRVVFFNHYHNGDIHASRGFVRKIIEYVYENDPTTTFFYNHSNMAGLLADIPNLGVDIHSINIVGEHSNLVRISDTIYINTWYAQQQHKYLRQYGITFDSLYSAFDDTCRQLWKFSLNDISNNVADFFPVINYENFDIGKVKSWAKNNNSKKILIDNGRVLSNQATNFSFAPIVNDLANRHKDKSFILCHKENIQLPNVFYTNDIVGKQGTDLNEISYLSTFCDVIVGRASGAFTFTLTHENLFKRNVKFVCFSNLVSPCGKFWIGNLLKDRVNYSAKTITHNEYNPNRVLNIIESELK